MSKHAPPCGSDGRGREGGLLFKHILGTVSIYLRILVRPPPPRRGLNSSITYYSKYVLDYFCNQISCTFDPIGFLVDLETGNKFALGVDHAGHCLEPQNSILKCGGKKIDFSFCRKY